MAKSTSINTLSTTCARSLSIHLRDFSRKKNWGGGGAVTCSNQLVFRVHVGFLVRRDDMSVL